MSSADDPWVTRALGLTIGSAGDDAAKELAELVTLGLRKNPRRAHLLVSSVLGKHVAARPATVTGAAHRLGDGIRDAIGPGVDVDVLGMAETATGLGHCVADRLDAVLYLHTTRRPAGTVPVYSGFQEGHSHATDHTVQPTDASLFDADRPLVLVDDEISTGKTALAAIEALHGRRPRPRYVVASLIDMRTEHDEEATARAADRLGVTIDHVSLVAGWVTLPDNVVDQVAALPPTSFNRAVRERPGRHRHLALAWPSTVPDGGRHGFLRSDRDAFETALHDVGTQVAEHLDPRRPVLVVGHEEFMYLPLRAAEFLASRRFDVRFQTTTRSPAYVMDVPDYPLRRGYRFTASELGTDELRYMYNGWPADGHDVDPQLVLILDAQADTPRLVERGGAAEVLSAVGYDVIVAAVRGADVGALAEHRRGGPR